MRLVFLFLYIISVSSGAFAVGVLFTRKRVNASDAERFVVPVQRALYVYTVFFFVWFMCAQYFTPREVNPVFFALAHLCMYCALFRLLYLSMTDCFQIPVRTRWLLLVCLGAFAVGILLVLSVFNLLIPEAERQFFDRYDDLAALSGILVLYSLFINRRSGHTAALLLLASAVCPLLDISFVYMSGSLFFMPVFFLTVNVLCITGYGVMYKSDNGPDLFSQAGITPRERVVLDRLLSGDPYARIADIECISVHTVKSHARNAYRKLGVSSRHQLSALFTR